MPCCPLFPERCIILSPMNFNSTIIATVLLLAVSFSCKRGDSIWNDETADIVRKEVTATLQQYHRDIEAKGMLGEIPYLDSSDEFSWYAPGYDGPIGYDSVVSVLTQMAPMYTKIDHTWDTLAVTPASEIQAIYTGVVTTIMMDTLGRTSTLRFKETGTIVRRKDGWKLQSGKTEMIN